MWDSIFLPAIHEARHVLLDGMIRLAQRSMLSRITLLFGGLCQTTTRATEFTDLDNRQKFLCTTMQT